MGPTQSSSLLEIVLKQAIGIALKSSKAATYIERLISLDADSQESLGVVVEESLAAIGDGNSGRSES